jgi:hypothetical protein
MLAILFLGRGNPRRKVGAKSDIEERLPLTWTVQSELLRRPLYFSLLGRSHEGPRRDSILYPTFFPRRRLVTPEDRSWPAANCPYLTINSQSSFTRRIIRTRNLRLQISRLDYQIPPFSRLNPNPQQHEVNMSLLPNFYQPPSTRVFDKDASRVVKSKV